jgi:uncharacterized GH25 family protein
MNTTWRFLLVSAAAVLLGVNTRAQMPPRAVVQKAAETGTNDPQFKCSGTVTDAAGHPLAGATVEYWRYEGNPFMATSLTAKKEVITGANGAFEFQVSRAAGVLVAHKAGLALAWMNLNQPFGSAADTEEHLALTPAGTLAGVVVDEADKPVANAEVSVAAASCEMPQQEAMQGVNYLIGKPAHDLFATHTDATGRFRIEGFPTNASAALAAEATGKALREQEQSFTDWNSLPCRAGQDDIKLVMKPAGAIEGKIVVEGSNQPPPVARLTARRDGPGFFGQAGREAVTSGADGAFQFQDLGAGSYSIHATFGTNAVPEWVADAAAVSVEAGQTARGVQVSAMRGGFLEAALTGKEDAKPVAHIAVNAYKENYQSAGTSDSNGIALLRLPPGDYQVMASSPTMSGSQTSASVEAGKTNRVELEIAAPKKVTGIVRHPNGQPAAGLPVRIVGGFGPNSRSVKSDADGKFELEWNQRQFGPNNTTACVLVRDAEHNLAVAQDIDEDTGPLDLKLAPGLTLAGRAECDGKPVSNATAAVTFWIGNRGMNLPGFSSGTNAPGQFEITALPPGRKYGIRVSAPGYGQRAVNDVNASSEGGRMELDPIELKLANLKLAGQVLDTDDKPVARISVMLYGEGQPNANTSTDREGRFRFEHVCEGPAQVQASRQGSFGNASAEGGDTNVVLQLGQRMGNSMPGSQAHKLQGTVTDADGKPVASAELTVFPSSFGDAQWAKSAAGGAYHLTWSLQPWQVQQSGGEGLLVARDPARNMAATEDLPEDTTNLDVKLKAALTVTGLVSKPDDSPLAGAHVSIMLKAGNTFGQFNEQQSGCDGQGRYEIKCLPPDGSYLLFATAKGYGQGQQQFQGDPETNRMELSPFVLQLADRVLAGQVLNENDKPVSGAMVQVNGQGQPNDNVTTDSKGRFHFQVCEGQVRLFANSPQGGGFAQASAEAGDTNVVMTLSSQPGMVRQSPHHAPLKGNPLPDLAGVNLGSDSAPAGHAVLLCLFDAGQRSSRHLVQQLNEQAAALRQQSVTVLGVQAAVTSDQILNDWKSASPVSFPLGRVTEKSEKSKWASDAPALPWLILTDTSHRVIAEGFAFDELDAQIKKLAK